MVFDTDNFIRMTKLPSVIINGITIGLIWRWIKRVFTHMVPVAKIEITSYENNYGICLIFFFYSNISFFSRGGLYVLHEQCLFSFTSYFLISCLNRLTRTFVQFKSCILKINFKRYVEKVLCFMNNT